MTLDEAIEQLVNLGEKDPLVIARKIQERHDKHWLAKELAAHAEDIIAEFARKRIGGHRRSAEVVPARPKRAGELMLQSKWVPDVGWKRLADFTAADCRAVASHYRMLAAAAGSRASMFDHWAQIIESEGVATLGAVKRALPTLELEEAA